MPPPASLKPFLQFQKLPGTALGPVRKAVEADDVLRRRVALVATEDNVGRAGWLWVVRPEGWHAELDQVAIEAAAANEAEAGAKAERDARKRVDAAEREVRTALADTAVAVASLDAERTRREGAEAALAKAERRLQQVEIELGGARKRVEQAQADVEVARREAADAHALAEQHRHLLEAAREAGVEAHAELVLLRSAPPAVAPSPVPPNEPVVASELAGAASALWEAAAATAHLGRALAAAAASLAADQADGLPAPAPRLARPVRAARRRRTPLALPGGMFEDTIEAATHLVRVPGIVLVVDGYNVAMLGWPALGLPAQRERLLDALDELAARFGTEVQVVFDGAAVDPVPGLRRQVRVRFSPDGVLADDVIVELVRDLPADQPVVVATNDGEVRSRSRAEGANLVSSDQLLTLARRC